MQKQTTKTKKNNIKKMTATALALYFKANKMAKSVMKSENKISKQGESGHFHACTELKRCSTPNTISRSFKFL